MSNSNLSLVARMKRYEAVPKNYLTRRMPAVIRIDGKSFHTFTRGMVKPFDSLIVEAMQETMRYLCENIQGCVLGYTQSDEISLVLTDYDTIQTDAWLEYNVQKMASIAASMATLAFNQYWKHLVETRAATDPDNERLNLYKSRIDRALFDARVFTLPHDEVCNYLIWRQQDATRNSIQALGQSVFSQKMLNGKKCAQIQEMLWQTYGINWNNLPTELKRGSCCTRRQVIKDMHNSHNASAPVARSQWRVDKNIPIFTQNREYVNRYILCE